jgi:hypothetical protein
LGQLEIWAVDNPIDADLFKDKNTAVRVLTETLSGNTNIVVLYDEDNPPQSVVELHINYEKYYVGGVYSDKKSNEN